MRNLQSHDQMIEAHKIDETEIGETESKFVLSHKEAEAASPDDMAVCGEEDPGEGLEFLVADEHLVKSSI